MRETVNHQENGTSAGVPGQGDLAAEAEGGEAEGGVLGGEVRAVQEGGVSVINTGKGEREYKSDAN